nr:FAD-dependent oxidoreductase [Oscillospiraceae bacterium]
MILVRDLKLRPGEPEERLAALAAKKLRVPPEEIEACRLVRRSIDARKKPEIAVVCSAAVKLRHGEAAALRRGAERYEPFVPDPPPPCRLRERPVVVVF